MAVKVHSVDENSIASRLGFAPGDELIQVDDEPINDVLDYQFYTDSPNFHLKARIAGVEQVLDIEKEIYEPFGCNFETYLGDKKHSCSNHCMFCFVDQLPPGMRESLYFKDDDERLDFLFGNYITMTNMGQHEIDRIIKMHISPINVSVHATDPQLRIRMLANKRAGEVLTHLKKMAEAGIELNCQLVMCPGVNDGDQLRRTLTDLLDLGPSVQSIAAVPFGMTRYREKLYHLEPYTQEGAAATLDILEEYGDLSLAKYGRRIVLPSDEFFLQAGRPIPPAEYYEDYAQLENGVGMWRLFREEFLAEINRPHRVFGEKRVDIVTGTLAAPLIREMTQELTKQYPMIQAEVHGIRNDFFGGNVDVAGLVTGTDILAQCKGKLTGDTLYIPEVMLRAEKDLFLDGLTPAGVAQELGTKFEIVPAGGGDLAKTLLRTGLRLNRRRV